MKVVNQFDVAKQRIEYNCLDLGEFGKVIRLQYIFNILDDLQKDLRDAD